MNLKNTFNQKVAIVTGGGSGIGEAICLLLAQNGATVIIADINLPRAQAVQQQIEQNNGKAQACYLDTTNPNAVSQLIQTVVKQHNTLDYMFNNAGIAVGGEVYDMDFTHWEKQLSVNLMGVIYGTAEAYKVMVNQGQGHIVNTASLAGLVPFPSAVPYATSKHAVVGLSRSLRMEAQALGVKVSCICPGFVDTRIYNDAITVKTEPQEVQKNIPFKFLPAPKAAQYILKGVAQNQEIIIFPFHARLLRFFSNYFPVMLQKISQKSLGKLRTDKLERIKNEVKNT